MKWTSDPRIWGLIGFGVGAVFASGGSLRSPADALFGGVVQAGIWFFLSRFIIRRKARRMTIHKMEGSESIEGKALQTLFLFDRPLSGDWLFYVFLVIALANVVNGISNVMESGGFTLDSFGLVSGLLDGAFRIFFSWFPIVPIAYSIRKIVRKKRNSNG